MDAHTPDDEREQRDDEREQCEERQPQLVSILKIAELPDMPRPPALYKLFRRDPRPPYCVFARNEVGRMVRMIDVGHPEWLKYVRFVKRWRKKRKKNAQERASGGLRKKWEPLHEDQATAQAMQAIEEDLKAAKLREDVRKRQIENRLLEIKLHEKEGKLIDLALAEFLYFGYMDRVASELLRLQEKLAPLIDNLVREQDADGILELLKREHSVCIQESKKAQARDLKRWLEEHGQGN